MSFGLDALDKALNGGGGKSFFNANTPVGAEITGTIKSVSTIQATDYMTKQAKTWDNGDPMLQAAITLETSLREDAEDDGTRTIYVKLWGSQQKALSEAVRATGKTKASEVLVPGAVFTARFAGTTPSKTGSPTKVYEYRVQPPQTVALNQALTPPAQAQAPVPAQAPAPAPAQTQAGSPDVATQVQTLHTTGIPPQQIAAATGLTIDQVHQIIDPAPF